MRDSQVSTYIPYTTLFLSARLEHSKHDGGRMTAYYEEDDPAHSRLDLALWSRILAHARTYRRSLAGLAAAGMVVALCDVDRKSTRMKSSHITISYAVFCLV